MNLGTPLSFDAAAPHAARIAQRRAFVEMKQCFIAAVAGVPGAVGDSLRWKVRHAAGPQDLWRLRRAVFALLSVDATVQRLELQRHLDSAFPGLDDPTTGFVAL